MKEKLEKDLIEKEETLEKLKITMFQLIGQISYIKIKLKELEALIENGKDK